jgi:putative tryptophan/tyrosine transport system substrate-binding protein
MAPTKRADAGGRREPERRTRATLRSNMGAVRVSLKEGVRAHRAKQITLDSAALSDMDRRAFVAGSLALLAAPLAVEAQQAGTVPRIGFLETGSLSARAPLWEAFRQAMRELGYVESRTVVFEARGADGKPERLPALVAELVRSRVDVIVTSGTSAAQAAHQATATIAIVMATGSDPVGLGLVASLARPGGNVTGVTTLTTELSAKRLELAREVVPGASRLAILGDAGSGAATTNQIRDTKAAARALGVRLDAVTVRRATELEVAFSTIARERPAVLLIISAPMFFGERRRLADLALKHRLPTVHADPEYAEAGGLIAYGINLSELFRRAAVYVDKILKGAKPADLPVEQPTKFELVINLKTAKALGLTIPQSLLLRADEVIQ